jgi:hypothetical protein
MTEGTPRTCSINGCEDPVKGRGWCAKHYKRWRTHGDPEALGVSGPPPRLVSERIAECIDKDGPVPAHRPELGPCWLWRGELTDGGYGRLKISGRMQMAHRLVYEEFVGEIPAGLTLDHLCRNRACVNPAHVEPVTNRVNVLRGVGLTAMQARQTHCKRGHPLSGDNLYVHRGMRHCKTCKRERAAA